MTTDLTRLIGVDEITIFTPKHDVYPLIDPAPLFKSQVFKNFVVLITGGGRGIGASIATDYARAGAHLVLTGRGQPGLEARAATLAKDVPGVRVKIVVGDISKPEVAKQAVQTAVDAFGKLDIVVANAAVSTSDPHLLGDKDPLQWWYTQEVNTRGTFGVIHAALPELQKTCGQIVAITSVAAHMRFPHLSDYHISKHTINRLIELVAIEYPDIKAYSVHPGAIETQTATEVLAGLGIQHKHDDAPALPAATLLWLTSRNAEFLSGRYVQATWDLTEVVAAKDEIVRDNLLVTKLVGPRKSA